MSYKNAAAAVSLRASAAASFAVVRQIPFDRRTVPAKPIIASATMHAPAHDRIHGPANGPAQVKRIDDAPQAARLARRDRLVLRHLPLVKAIAIRTQKNVPVHVDLDDLVRVGILGLFDAASKFNPEKHDVFSSCAKHYIKGAMLDSLRQLDCIPAHAPPAQASEGRSGGAP